METKPLHATILGGGSFGTAIANILADNNHHVSLWMRNEKQVEEIRSKHENTRYLPGYKLNTAINPTTDICYAVQAADLIFVAIPSKAYGAVVDKIKHYVKPSQIIVSTTKGIQQEGFTLMSQVLRERTCSEHIGVLSGPNLAKEITARCLTGTVIASESEFVRETVQKNLSCEYFRVYANSDVFGVELAGALKNIYAIASGMGAALNMGENTKSMLLTRSLAEMSRFAETLGANPLTFLGLAGVGDLFATCNSPLSRNFQVGQALAQGVSLQAVVENLGGTAEGINTVRTVKAQSEVLGVYMPIVNGLHSVIFEKKPVKEVVQALMLGEHNSDVEFVLPGPHNRISK